ncbi:TPA: methyltransferase domain-containing protein [Legionella pneumophila subsp. pneumophila]|nr:methyltransferase domain-containing protein [Legionella pneumophila]HAT8832306.1 methyltransferase domain-containing protein [Legionella pneumophila subsp. pneumophila]TIE26490.1 class I SAM-dependent methyltransferase [Legionella pneumophila]TIE48010.1 class I SAM-dependent methyltransferase [Legionella pneumophila]HAT8335119.1 methyltransferase domain-containing protein [Legionella pneumophila]
MKSFQFLENCVGELYNLQKALGKSFWKKSRMDNESLLAILNNWSATNYAKGNYILREISSKFLAKISIHSNDYLLDAGCGDGSFTQMLASLVPDGYVLGLDRSKTMIDYANKHCRSINVRFDIGDIQEPIIYGPFDNILSFWCLHWTDLEKSLSNLYHVLKPGGKICAIFSSGKQSTLFEVLNSLQFQNLYPDVAKNVVQSKMMRENYSVQCRRALDNLPFKSISFVVEHCQVELPDLGLFENFIHGAPLFKDLPGKMYQDIVNSMVQFFDDYCKKKYGGKWVYETTPYFLTITRE